MWIYGLLALEISRSASRPRVSRELRELIQRMSKENPLWGAPRIHGELLKLGFEIAESTVSKYMIQRRGPPSQTWRTFLRNHADAIAAIDLCVVPTLTFECPFAFLVLGHGRRQLLWFAVTRHPTAEWLAQEIVEAFPWDDAPTVNGFACCVWPNLATFDVFHIHAAGLGTTSTIFQYLAAGCSPWVKKLKQ
jgi:hypothetical protein